MAGFIHFLKALLIPLFLALTLYLLLIHVLLPLLRRNRQLYTPYLPLSTSTTTASTLLPTHRTSFRTALFNLFVPNSMRHRTLSPQHEDPDDLFDDEEGEGMVGFDPIDERRREALEQRRSLLLEGVGVGTVGVRGVDEEGGGRRLSRELEEGFRDESSSEDESGSESDDGEGRRDRRRGRGDERIRGSSWF